MTSPHKIESYNYGVPDDRAEFVRGNERAIIHGLIAEFHAKQIMPRQGTDWRFASWALLKLMSEVSRCVYDQQPPEDLQP